MNPDSDKQTADPAVSPLAEIANLYETPSSRSQPAANPRRRLSWPSYSALKVYLKYCVIIDVAFLAVYFTCNWWTSRRSGLLAIYFDWELSIPFVPAMIWGYGSMLILFLFPLFQLDEAGLRRLGRQILLALPIAGLSFLMFPAEIGFVRPDYVPGYDAVYQFIYTVDYPHNLVPSLHIVFSTLIIAAMMDVAAPLWRWGYALWLTVISVSVVLVHQHHIADVLSGYLLAWVCRNLIAEYARVCR